MINIEDQIHLVQTKKWNEFKRSYGNKVAYYQNFYFLVKKIPFSKKYMGYAPKVNLNIQKIDFKKLKKYCLKNNIAFVRFDVPNVSLDTPQGKHWCRTLKKLCKKSPRNTFTKQNLYLDISLSEEELLKNMHQKRRYNIRYAQRKGIRVKIRQDRTGLDNFYTLHKNTSSEQGFLTHPKEYFKEIQNKLNKDVYFVEASYNNTVLVSWFVVVNDNTGYYVYGGSKADHRNLYPSDLVGFEVIKLAKNKGAELLDFWGAEEGKGFTDFKRRYGATTINYIPTNDFVVDNTAYKQFNFLYQSFWKLQKIKNILRLRLF